MVKIYVGNLSYDESDDTLAGFFADYGDVHTAEVVLYRKSGKSRGFGFVEMDDHEADIAIENLNGKTVNGRVLKVNVSDPSVNTSEVEDGGAFTRLYVGNMRPDHDVTFLSDAFGQHGRIMSAMIINDGETGEPEGFGFVEMEDNDAAVRAIAELDGKEIDGVTIRVNWAKPKPRKTGFHRKRYQ